MKWVSTWKYIPIRYDMELAKIENCTQRVIFPNNLNGDKVRILLSNKWGKNQLVIDKMTIGTVEKGVIKELSTVRLNGNSVIRLASCEEVFSDEINLHVFEENELMVSAYIKEKQSIGSVCCFWANDGAKVLLNQSGDVTDGAAFEPVPADIYYPILETDTCPDKAKYFYGFSAVQVYTEDFVHLIAAFGDSITHMSYVTNELTKRLYQCHKGQVAVINCGIGGNRLVHDATYIEDAPAKGGLFGKAGVERFEEDIYGIDAVDTVIALEGINDIMHPLQFENAKKATPPEDIIEGYKKIAQIAHKHGSAIFGATVTPAGNETYSKEWINAMEDSRLAVNEWLRKQNTYDGLFDYDMAVRDDNKSGYMREGLSIGDGLHPNVIGAVNIVNCIDIELLLNKTEKGDYRI